MLLSRTRRRAFTLVELMVAAALAVTIMWILAESFKMGIDFARNARSTGDMMTQLNNVGQTMMRDLGQTGALSAGSVNSNGTQHFLTPGAMRNIAQVPMPDNMAFPTPNGLIPPNLQNSVAYGYAPPAGYFHVCSPPPNLTVQSPNQSAQSFQDDTLIAYIDSVTFPQDPTGTTGAARGNMSHQFHFTAYLPTGLPQNQFVATCFSANGTQVYYSRAAEIAWFLGPMNANGVPIPTGYTEPQIMTPGLQTEQPYLNQYVTGNTPGRLPLYSLYRRQRLIWVTSDLGAVTAPQNLTAAILQPPNMQAAIWPTIPATGQPNPYYDATAADVLSFTQLPTTNKAIPIIYQPNTLPDFGAGYSPSAAPWLNPPLTPPPGAQPMQANRIVNVPQQQLIPYQLGMNGPPPMTLNPNRLGDDLVLSNVLSFEVLPTWVPNPTIPQPPFKSFYSTYPPQGTPIPGPRPYVQAGAVYNSNYPYDYLPLMNFNAAYLPYTFDTWWSGQGGQPGQSAIPSLTAWYNFRTAPNNANLIPMPIRVTGLQITVRIYDPKTHQARQNTWRVAL